MLRFCRCPVPSRKDVAVDVRKATIFGIASIAILIAGLVIESHFDIFPDDDGD